MTGPVATPPAIDCIADAAFAPVLANIADGGVPGAVLGIVGMDGTRAVRFAGHAMIEPERIDMTPGLWFDLASLTKVIFTTTAILRLVDEGRLSLDTPLGTLIPDLRQYDVANAPERRLTVRQCLTHQTFLPAVEPVYTHVSNPQTARAYVLQREYRHGPPVYSDFNFMLLGIVIERLTGLPLDRQPLPPQLGFAPDPAQTVATERCTWRGQVMRGIVHDENAYAFGGAAGHAGLFGTIDGVLGFAHGILGGGGISAAALAEIRRPAGAGRTVGWVHGRFRPAGDTADAAGIIGHTGFTGTDLWIDFERQVAWSLLTNRVHPTRHRETGIAALRDAVGGAIIGVIDGAAAG